MQPTTIGRHLIQKALPPEYQSEDIILDGKTAGKLFSRLALEHPDKYSEIMKQLNDVAVDAQGARGGVSPSIRHFKESAGWKKQKQELRQQIARIYKNPKLSPNERKDEMIKLMMSTEASLVKNVFGEAESAGNPLTEIIKSGMKGKPSNLNELLGAPLLFTGMGGKTIPVPILNGYAHGLSPSEYWAASYGTRKALADTKLGTGKAGFMAKKLVQIAHQGVVTDDDDPETANDESRGLPVEVDDEDNIGALLARNVGGYKRNTIITAKVLRDLNRQGIKKMLVRSPMVGGPQDGSLYAKDVGLRETGRIPIRGENPGVAAAQALAEPISQSSLSCLAKGTQVRMADFSTRRIEHICVGDYVLGVDENLVGIPVRVSRTFNNGVRECYETHFTEGLSKKRVSVISTLEHLFLGEITQRINTHIAYISSSGKKRYRHAETLLKGEYPIGHKSKRLSVSIINGTYAFGGEDEPMALLLGLLLGNGCYTDAVNGPHFSCFDDSLIEDTKEYMDGLGVKFQEYTNHYGYYGVSKSRRIVDHDADGRLLGERKNPVTLKLKSLGMYGKYAHEKRIPKEAHKWNKRSLAALIGGLFATDGSVYRSSDSDSYFAVSFGFTSLRLLTQIKSILFSQFGISSGSVEINRCVDRKQDTYRKHDMYCFAINKSEDLELFFREIPVFGVKRGKADMLLAEQRKNRKTGISYRKFYRREQIYVGQLPTYDLEVESSNHLYVLANGLITHNSKHSSGVQASERKSIGGFKHISQMIETPKESVDYASHAMSDGVIQKIDAAPQGGSYVFINNAPHYVHPDNEVTVKPGQEIEAGDIISSGLPNPAKVVEYKGIGEGRRYFAQEFTKLLRNSGITVNRRNVELVARGLVNHVELESELDDYIPGDKVPYNMLEKYYQPRENSREMDAKMAIGKHLERPILHYSIGTRIRPSVVRDLEEMGMKDKILVHDDPPPFKPVMVRGMAVAGENLDWIAAQQGSGIKSSTLRSVQRGRNADPYGTSYVSGIVLNKHFGEPNDKNKIVAPIFNLETLKRHNADSPKNPYG
ncbi:hypothetical protein FACS189443_1720 [Planctomycetales bacterium]|nr:hypothetical protein FACS189443_1720 [Planctomycetales bacterium]